MNKEIVEVIGTYLYVLVNLYSRNAIIVSLSVASLDLDWVGCIVSVNHLFESVTVIFFY